MKDSEIMVSICCITYNQRDYIIDALEGFINQKANFKYEVIIHDDASTDGTIDIIKEYEKKYPEIIKPIFEEENQYSKGKKRILNINFKEAKGKYIALCEGDDYWIDEKKLQKQVDYMEKNDNCSLCFHNAIVKDMSNGTTRKFIPNNKLAKKYIKKNNIYNVGELELLEFIPTASFLFRRENLKKMPDWFDECFVGDWPLKLIMASFGYAYCIDEEMSVYRLNAKGSVTVKNANDEKKSIEKKKYIVNEKIKIMDWINEFTEYKYENVFEIRKCEFTIDLLITQRKTKEIRKGQYLKRFNLKKKIKYLIRMYCPYIVEIYRKIRKGRC